MVLLTFSVILRYPGPDYRNPAPNLFKPLRAPPVKDPNNPQPDDDLDDEVIEVEVRIVTSVLYCVVSAVANTHTICCLC